PDQMAAVNLMGNPPGFIETTGHADRTTAEQIVVIVIENISGNAGPEQCQRSAISIIGSDAGSTNFKFPTWYRDDGRKLTLALRIESATFGSLDIIEQTGGGDNLAADIVDHEQVVTVVVIPVDIQPRCGRLQVCTVFSRKDFETEALGCTDLFSCSGDLHEQF